MWIVRKTCDQCGNKAAVTICWLLSTVGVSPRAQECSRASTFCLDCLGRLCGGDGVFIPPTLKRTLGEAYTAALEAIQRSSHLCGVPKPVRTDSYPFARSERQSESTEVSE